MKLNQDLGSLVLDLGDNDDTVKVSQDEQGRIKVSGDGLYDLVFAKPLNLLAIRGGAGVDKVVLDSVSLGGGLRIEAETIELLQDKTVTAGGDVLFEALSRITSNPETGDAQGKATTLVDVQGTLVTKGLVTLSSRSIVDLQTTRNGDSADLNLSALAEARTRLGSAAAVTAAGLQLVAVTDVRLVAELSAVSSGTLVLDAKQTSEAALLGNAQVTIGAKVGDTSPQVLVEASGLTQIRGVVSMASRNAEDTINASAVNERINLDRNVLAQVGDGLQRTVDGQTLDNKVVVVSADGRPAPSLQVSALAADRASGGVRGELVSSPYGVQRTQVNNRVAAEVNGSTLNLSRLDVSALDSSGVSSLAREAYNTGVTNTSVLLRNSTVTTSGNASLVAIDATSWNAQGGAYSVNFTGDGVLGASRAGNLLRADVSAQVTGSTVTATDLRVFAKGSQTLKASVADNQLDPVSDGQLDEWVNTRAQRAWNQLNGSAAHPSTFRLYDRTYGPEPVGCDFFFVSESLKHRVQRFAVNQETKVSDHQPVLLELN